MGILSIKTQSYLTSYISEDHNFMFEKKKTQSLCLNINISVLKDMSFFGLTILFPKFMTH